MTAVAVIAVIVNVCTVLANIRVTSWRRRAGNVAQLREILREIAPVVDEDARPEAAMDLWAPSMAGRLDELLEEQERQADRRLRRKIKKFHDTMLRVRGGQQPTPEQIRAGTFATLTGGQKTALRDARALLGEIQDRLNMISRRAG